MGEVKTPSDLTWSGRDYEAMESPKAGNMLMQPGSEDDAESPMNRCKSEREMVAIQKEKAKKKDDEEENIGDIFQATVSAALEGLTVGNKQNRSAIHPIFPFIGCVLLAMLQVMLLGGVALEVKQKDYMSKHQNPYSSHALDMSLATDMCLLAVVQAMIFTEVYSAVRTCLYILRTTWQDADKEASCLWFWSGMLLAFVANFLRGSVAYLTSKVSLSIILSNSELTDRIFNSLAVHFILELDDKLWEILREAFSLQAVHPVGLGRRKIGWARSADLLIITGIYIHQITHVFFAIQTGWLPTTTTICNVFSRFPSFVYDGKGWGAEALQSKLKFCKEHQFESGHLHMYREVFASHPYSMCSMVLFIGMINAAVFVKDFLFPEEDEERGHEERSKQALATDGNESEGSQSDV